MKSATFTGLVAFTTAVFAAPRPVISQTKSHGLHIRADTISQNSFAGVALTQPLSNNDPYSSVTAHFVVPTIQDKNEGYVTVSVGIDGFNPEDTDNVAFVSVISTGITIEMTGQGNTVYSPFYSWLPSQESHFMDNDFDAFPISPGDDLTFAISIAPTKDSAKAIITNAKTGLTLTADMSPGSGGTNAFGNSAEFTMHRAVNSSLVNFGTAEFTKCVAITDGGESVDLAGGPDGFPAVPVSLFVMDVGNGDTTTLATASIPSDQETTAQIVWSGPGATS